MRFFPILALLLAASAMHATVPYRRVIAIPGLVSRATTCKPVPSPFTCERSCGSGNLACVNDDMCYNPSAGEVCCLSGKYCPKDTYCSNVGCCPEEKTLKECGAAENQNYKPSDNSSSLSEPSSTSSETQQSATSMSGADSSRPTNPEGRQLDSTGDTGKDHTNVGAIVGGVIGSIAVIGAVVVGILWVIFRHRRKAAAYSTVGQAGNEGNNDRTEDNSKENSDCERETTQMAVPAPMMGYYVPNVSNPTLGSPIVSTYERPVSEMPANEVPNRTSQPIGPPIGPVYEVMGDIESPAPNNDHRRNDVGDYISTPRS